jgi:hypothetical protein
MLATIIAAASLHAAIAACSTDAAALRAKDQALLDAIATGDHPIWEKSLTPDAVYVDENGAIIARTDFMKSLTPLPKGIGGTLKITDYSARFAGDTALVLHKDDERENYFGIQLHANYIMTETWLCRGGQWQLAMVHAYVVAKDPPAIAFPSTELDEYTGRYTAGPELSATIRRDGDHLVFQRDGKPAQTLQIELRDVLFTPGQPRDKRLFQRDTKGHITGFIDRREGEDIVWRRAE